MKKAINSLGKEVNLPARPVKEEGETQDDFEERLSGWNHRVLPLLDLERVARGIPPRQISQEAGDTGETEETP